MDEHLDKFQCWKPGWICTKHHKAHDSDCGYTGFKPPHPEATQGELERILVDFYNDVAGVGELGTMAENHRLELGRARRAIEAYLTTTATRMAVEARKDELALANAWSLSHDLSKASTTKWQRYHSDRVDVLTRLTGGESEEVSWNLHLAQLKEEDK